MFFKDILIDLGLLCGKLFNDPFHVNQNYEQSIGPYISEFSILINQIMNTSSKGIFDKYAEELLK